MSGRSVRLDAWCVLGDGRQCNIEVQKEDRDDHLRRVRYNASALTCLTSQSGSEFLKIPDVTVIYITTFDLFRGNRTVYHLEKVVRETGITQRDGLEEIFVNTAVKDGTETSGLMECFLQTEVTDPRFPQLSDMVHRI